VFYPYNESKLSVLCGLNEKEDVTTLSVTTSLSYDV